MIGADLFKFQLFFVIKLCVLWCLLIEWHKRKAVMSIRNTYIDMQRNLRFSQLCNTKYKIIIYQEGVDCNILAYMYSVCSIQEVE